MGGSGGAPSPYPPTTVFMPAPPPSPLKGREWVRGGRRTCTLLEDGLELELAAERGVGLHHLEAGHGVVVDVAVGVEAPLAVDALEVLGGGDRLALRLALGRDVLCGFDLR